MLNASSLNKKKNNQISDRANKRQAVGLGNDVRMKIAAIETTLFVHDAASKVGAS